MKTINGIGLGLGLVGLAAWTVPFAADTVASQLTEESRAAAQAHDRQEVAMEEIIVTARHPDAKRNRDEPASRITIDLSDMPIHSTDLAQSFMFDPEIRLSL